MSLRRTILVAVSAMGVALAGALGATGAPTASATPTANANLITNGCFEQPFVGAYEYISPGSATKIQGWTVVREVTLVGAYWQEPPPCKQSVALDGMPGVISQKVSTAAGVTYLLRFELAAHPVYQGLKTVGVSWDSKLVDSPTFNTTGHSETSMGWVAESVRVTATSRLSVVRFADATVPNNGFSMNGDGPVITDVSLTALDEVVNGFTTTAASDPYSQAVRQMLAKVPGKGPAPSSGATVCTLAPVAANLVKGGTGLQISWSVVPSVAFVSEGAASRLASAQRLDQYLTGLLKTSRTLYLAALQANGAPLQGNDLLAYWAVQLQYQGATGSLMSFRIAQTAAGETTTWSGIPGATSATAAPKALAEMLYDIATG